MESRFRAHKVYNAKDVILIKKVVSGSFLTIFQILMLFLYIIPPLLLFLIDGVLSYKNNIITGIIVITATQFIRMSLGFILGKVINGETKKEIEFTFYDDHMEIQEAGKSIKHKYSRKIKMKIKDKEFVIKTPFIRMYIIDKSDFILGSAEDFVQFMKNNKVN